MIFRTLLLLLALAGPTPAVGQPRRVDAAGDPLPEGALLRLGTTRWRAGSTVVLAAHVQARGLLTVSQDYLVQFWDDAGRVTRSVDISGVTPPRSRTRDLFGTQVALSGDGKRLGAQGADGLLRVWNIDDGSNLQVELGSGNSSVRMAISYDGARLAILGSNRTLGICEVAAGAQVRWLQPGAAGLNQYSYTVQFSPDGKHLLQTGLDAQGNVAAFARRWDVEKGTSEFIPLPTEVSTTTVSRSLVSPDHSLLVGPNGASVVMTDLKTGKLVHQFDNVGGDLRMRFAFSPDRRKLVIASSTDDTITVWDVATKKLLKRFGTPPRGGNRNIIDSGRASAPISVTPDGKTLLLPQDSTVRLVDLESGATRNETEGHAGAIRAVSFDTAGKFILTRGTDMMVRDWDPTTGQPRGRMTINPRHYYYATSPDGRWLAANDRLGVYRVIEVASGADHFTLADDRGGYGSVVLFSPDSRTLAHCARTSQGVSLYDVHSGRVRTELRSPDIVGADVYATSQPAAMSRVTRVYPRRLWFSADSRLLAIAAVRAITVWDTVTGHQVGRVSTAELDNSQNLAISPDGCSIVTESASGLIVWELATGGKRYTLTTDATSAADRSIVARVASDPSGSATPLAYSPDGRLLAVAQSDNSIKLWDIANRKEVERLEGHGGQVLCVAFAPDGRRLLSAGADTTALLWDLSPILDRLKPRRAKIAAGGLDALWNHLLDANAKVAADAIRELAGDPDAAVPYLRQRVRPAEGPSSAHIANLIAALDAPKYAARDRAARELARLGELVNSELREAAENGVSPEARGRAKRVLERLVYRVPTGERLRIQRALEVLEQAATPEAIALLKELAAGAPLSIPTLHARATLQRLGP